jgi:uncharacterized membrane protein
MLSIKNLLVKILVLIFNFLTVFSFCTAYSFSQFNILAGLILGTLTSLILLLKDVKILDFSNLMIIMVGSQLFNYLNVLLKESIRYVPSISKITKYLPYLSIVVSPVLLLIYAFTFSYILFHNNNSSFANKFLNNFINSFIKTVTNTAKKVIYFKYFFVIIPIICGLYYAILSYFFHSSFGQAVFDFGIFDQLLFMLSHDSYPPASSTRQIENLFYDHQHFSLYLLSPLYWLFRGLNGYLLTCITPFFLITAPSIILHFTYKNIQKLIKVDFPIVAASISSICAIYLSSHPYTQSAISFSFHEKYILPVFITSLLYFFIKYLQTRKLRDIILMQICAFLWIGTKEDQGVFLVGFIIQLFIINTFILKQKFLKDIKLVIFSLFNIIFVPSYLYYILKIYKVDSFIQYGSLFTNVTKSLQELASNGNIALFMKNTGLFDDVVIYLVQNYLVFDSIGSVFNTIPIFGNYAQRIFSDGYSLKNPVFHYGVDVPLYSLIGLIFMFAFITKFNFFKKTNVRAFILFPILIGILGFPFVSGWNNVFYLASKPTYLYEKYVSTQAVRRDLYDLKAKVGIDDSIIVSDYYATHFTAREKVNIYPDPLNLPNTIKSKLNYDEYKYWLISKQQVEGMKQVDNLLTTKKYVIEGENQSFILIKKI